MEEAKLKNDVDAYVEAWIDSEQIGRRILGGFFIVVTVSALILINPFQYNLSDTSFLMFYVFLLAIPALGGAFFLAMSFNREQTRRQVEKMIEKPSKYLQLLGFAFIAVAIMYFFTGSGEQKLLFAPCFIGMGIYQIWRDGKYKTYLSRNTVE